MHVSTTDPDAKLANKGNGLAAMVGYTVNGLMENQHRLLLGINVETFRGPVPPTQQETIEALARCLLKSKIFTPIEEIKWLVDPPHRMICFPPRSAMAVLICRSASGNAHRDSSFS